MPRSVVRRSWTFILVLGVLLAAPLTHPPRSHADLFPEEGSGGGGGSGNPTGVGDPDVPVNTQIKKERRGGLGIQRNVGFTTQRIDARREVVSQSTWVWRFTVVTQVMRIYWTR